VKIVHIIVGSACVAFIGGAALVGIWAWYRAPQGRLFWILLRVGQGAIVLEAALGGLWELEGHHASGLHLIYGLVPIAVSFVAEQLRIASAQMVLDSRGYESAAEVGELDPARAACRRALDRPARARGDGARGDRHHGAARAGGHDRRVDRRVGEPAAGGPVA
jgi:hypothetical protein